MTSAAKGVSAPLRVLYVDNSLGFGGAVISLSILLRGLPTVDKFVLTSQDREIIQRWFADVPVSSFRRVINYRNKDRLLAGIRNAGLRWFTQRGFAVADTIETFRNSLRLIWFLRRHRIDLIHLNNGFLPPEALFASRLAGVPCVVHLRDFQRERISSTTAASVAGVIAISNAVADSLRGNLVGTAKITMIHDAIDLERAGHAAAARDRIRVELGIAEDEIAVGIFGRVIPWKGQLEFVQAMIPAVRANKLLRPVIIGDESDGDRGYLDNLKLLIREAGLEEAFILAGYRSNVEEFFAAVDIVVHASITPEPLGRVVPEAMAARRPIIAANAGGPPELIDQGIDGILFPPGDVAALTDAVSTLAADGGLRGRMGAAGAAKAAARFGIATDSKQVAAVYAEVLHREHRLDQ
jgi:glycosyltransferase involved in cell wall biosynthesis